MLHTSSVIDDFAVTVFMSNNMKIENFQNKAYFKDKSSIIVKLFVTSPIKRS